MKIRAALLGAGLALGCQNPISTVINLSFQQEVFDAISLSGAPEISLTFRLCKTETGCDDAADFLPEDTDGFTQPRADFKNDTSFVLVPDSKYSPGEEVMLEMVLSTEPNARGEVLGYGRRLLTIPRFLTPRTTADFQFNREVSPLAIQTEFVPQGARVFLQDLVINGSNSAANSTNTFSVLFVQEPPLALPSVSYPNSLGLQVRVVGGAPAVSGFVEIGRCVSLLGDVGVDFGAKTVRPVAGEVVSISNCGAGVEPVPATPVVDSRVLDSPSASRKLDAVLIELSNISVASVLLDGELQLVLPSNDEGNERVTLDDFAFIDLDFALRFAPGDQFGTLRGVLEVFENGNLNPDPQGRAFLPRANADIN